MPVILPQRFPFDVHAYDRIEARIAASIFMFTEEFPQFHDRKTLHLPFSARTCGDVFDAFLLHQTERVGWLAPSESTAHRVQR